MASLRKRKNVYQVRFYYKGQKGQVSLGRVQPKQAKNALSQVEARLAALQSGLDELPEDVSLEEYLLHGPRAEPAPEGRGTIHDMIARYREAHRPPAKAESTVKTERTHLERFAAYACESDLTDPCDITREDIEDYLQRFLDAPSSRRKGNATSPNTVNRHLRTLKQLFAYGAEHGWTEDNVCGRIKECESVESDLRFMTKREIEEAIERGGRTEDEIDEMWRYRYLPDEAMKAFLDYVAEVNGDLYPLVCGYACTGARCGELLKLEWSDVDLPRRKLWLRSRKQTKRTRETSRQIPINDRLSDALYQQHQQTGAKRYVFGGERMFSSRTAYNCIERTLRGSEYERIRFHNLRHSFASNLAAAGVDDRIIDKLMGHTTEPMRRRYQHLRPEQSESAVDKLDY